MIGERPCDVYPRVSFLVFESPVFTSECDEGGFETKNVPRIRLTEVRLIK